MFDKENQQQIIELISAKHKDAYIVPIYVSIQGKEYLITELDQLESFNTSGMKMGFGAVKSLFDRLSFPDKHSGDFEVVTVFTSFDENKNTMIRYMVFETGAIDESETNNVLFEQISYYYNQLRDYVNSLYQKYREQLMTSLNES